VPEIRREVRDHVRKQLAWLGFGPLAPSTYISPHDRLRQVANRLADQPEVRLDMLRCQSSGLPVDRDPELPVELLPDGWVGRAAHEMFLKAHELLRASAEQFYDEVAGGLRRGRGGGGITTAPFGMTCPAQGNPQQWGSPPASYAIDPQPIEKVVGVVDRSSPSASRDPD
jgi:DNA-binding transcriptional regulator PaaX